MPKRRGGVGARAPAMNARTKLDVQPSDGPVPRITRLLSFPRMDLQMSYLHSRLFSDSGNHVPFSAHDRAIPGAISGQATCGRPSHP
eukprot:6960117-Pyramimonas_sp.AAC.1